MISPPPQVVIIGAGTRVSRDVLPALSAAGFKSGIINIVRVKSEPVIGYKTFDNLDKLPNSVKKLNTIFIVCVPPSATKKVVEKIFFAFDPLMILIDTPIADYSFYKQLRSLEKSSKSRIGVLEDVYTIPFFFDALRQRIQNQNKYFRILLLNNFLFRYHSMAFIKKMDLGPLFLAIKISKWNLAITGNKELGLSFFISVFRNNYSHQNLISLFPKFQFLLNESLDVFGVDILERLEIDRFALINQPYKDNFQSWKKIGLYFGFKAARENQNIFPTISEQFRNQVLSGYRYNGSFLKRLLKRLFVQFLNAVNEKNK